ncbi:MAG TPA: site-specific integrase [Candidatus Hypogeohydataceae bacterium YC41]
MAIKWKKTDKNPVQEVKPCRVANILSPDDIKRLLTCSTGHTRATITVALNTAMRLREILNLVWEDVDLQQGRIVVRNTKTLKVRHIPVNIAVRDALTSIDRKDFPYVFPDPRTGKSYSNIRTSFATALKKAGISKLRFHDLRHTAASYMVLGGADLVTVKEVLGHSRIDTTLRYSHPTQDSKRYAIEVLAKLTNGIVVSENNTNKLTTTAKENNRDFLETLQESQGEKISVNYFH